MHGYEFGLFMFFSSLYVFFFFFVFRKFSRDSVRIMFLGNRNNIFDFKLIELFLHESVETLNEI